MKTKAWADIIMFGVIDLSITRFKKSHGKLPGWWKLASALALESWRGADTLVAIMLLHKMAQYYNSLGGRKRRKDIV